MRPTFQGYYLNAEDFAHQEMEKKAPHYLLGVDFDEYLDHLVSRYAWEPLVYHLDQLTVEPVTRKARIPMLEGTRQRDVPRLIFRIPIEPYPHLHEFLSLWPSHQRGSEPKWDYDSSTLTIEVAESPNAATRVREDVQFWIGGRNADIKKGNQEVRPRIEMVWREKRRQLEQQHAKTKALLDTMGVPLHRNPDSTHKPVTVRRRQLRTQPAPPASRTAHEPYLPRESVVKLVEFVEGYSRQFETAPAVYSALKEEWLRDLLLGMLQYNFVGSTSETFSKLGKTDLYLVVQRGKPLVAECKIWKGRGKYAEAIDQLFDYLTWRQSYGILIHFSKNKSMSNVISQAKAATLRHASCQQNTLAADSDSRFSTRHRHPQDEAKLAEIFHLFIDLYLPPERTRGRNPT